MGNLGGEFPPLRENLMKRMVCLMAWVGLGVLASGCSSHKPTFVSGSLEQYQPVTLSFNGPMLREVGPANPFTDYRMTVRFTLGKRVVDVPGYFASDGQAADTSPLGGHVWRVHFLPDEPGEWKYEATLLYGLNAAVNDDAQVSRVRFTGAKGTLLISPVNGAATGFYRTGPLRYTGDRYLQLANGQHFLINGVAGPENFLAYVDFNGSPIADQFLHHYLPHLQDWVDEQPTWQGGRGKSIIGAVNYLASQGVNGMSFSTYNIDGGNHGDVWVWSTPADKLHFDVAKLAQWEILFTHMDRLGMAMQLVTQEDGNNNILGKGQLRDERKLYYRELIARFAHHPGLIWNLGQANSNTDPDRAEFAAYIRKLDPYKHPIVIHAADSDQLNIFTPLLGFHALEGAALQAQPDQVHAETLAWVTRSTLEHRPWLATWNNLAEENPVVKDDATDPTHDDARAGLWANLMAGGSGTLWSGMTFDPQDLVSEDFRRYENLWAQGRFAVDFFQQHVPFAQMKPVRDGFQADGTAYCLAGRGVYLVYLAQGQTARLQTPPGRYQFIWFNPRTGQIAGQFAGPGQIDLADDPVVPTADDAPATDDATPADDADPINAVTVTPATLFPVADSAGELTLTPPENDGKDWVVLIRVWK